MSQNVLQPATKATGTEEVIHIAQRLIQIDTTNYCEGRAVGEAVASEYVAELLREVGLEPQIYEAAPNRTNVVARWKGTDPDLPALLIHAHLDVVPADPEKWTVDPFAGVIKDGMLWGRGAVDMKDMVAMILASVRDMIRRGERPKRDIVLAFFADEEDNSSVGSVWMIKNHPEVFAGVDAAISEVGGFSVEVSGRQVFLIQTGEKGILWLKLHASGPTGHASRISKDNAILEVAEAVSRIGREPWPVSLTATTEALIERLREIGDFPSATDPATIAEATGSCASFVSPGLLTVANVTMINGGYMANVIPGDASAFVDVRVLPGQRDQVLDRIRELAGPNVRIEIYHDVEGTETTFDGPLVEAMANALHTHCPDADVAPYLLAAGTDNAFLAEIGIRGYGFCPLLLPPDFDFPAMFHGHDERVPLDSLVFGQAVLTELLQTY
ncbi:M20/M25/M40 family metallo-hydrolase [Mycolicibacterium goodii]|uniref:M20/M25/M40 family metallo-hydrolase n=1 Tax=Mycolicibacterium goodii TaxID=134601 RepID=UPI001BDC24CC|nr:M20/M25/M40 family metallo-hydrolase [Mycolicibacterium goodii]MBU8828909.1 M20/M25/M40 family metallo-hydrolase [Mycolicibacterium goodii]